MRGGEERAPLAPPRSRGLDPAQVPAVPEPAVPVLHAPLAPVHRAVHAVPQGVARAARADARLALLDGLAALPAPRAVLQGAAGVCCVWLLELLSAIKIYNIK